MDHIKIDPCVKQQCGLRLSGFGVFVEDVFVKNVEENSLCLHLKRPSTLCSQGGSRYMSLLLPLDRITSILVGSVLWKRDGKEAISTHMLIRMLAAVVSMGLLRVNHA